jgi:hypothetical protein
MSQIRCSPSRNLTLPKGHEASPLRSPRDSDNPLKLWQKINQHVRQMESMVQVVDQLSKNIEKNRRRILGGQGGSSSISCQLYGNPTTQSYTVGTFYKLLDTDFAVTNGYVCAGSETPVKATAGKWLCLKSVPVLLNDGTDLPNYIPTLPAASGSLDPSNAGNYWEFFTPSQICVDGASQNV